jgi:hypothetical protein
MAFGCYANTAPFAIGVGLRSCYVEGADGKRYQAARQANPQSNEGPVTADGNVVPNIKDQRHRICLSAAAHWPDGGFQFATTPVCSPFE